MRIISTVFILGLLIWFVGPATLIAPLARVSLPVTAALALLLLVPPLLGGCNIWFLLQQSHPLPVRAVLKSYLQAWTIGLISPGQIGDASQVVFLKRYGVSAETAAAAWAFDKGVTLAWTTIVAVATAWLYLPVLWPAVGGLAILFMIAAAACLVHGRLRHWLRLRVMQSVSSVFGKVRTYLTSPRVIAVNVVLTLFRWGITGVCYHTAFRLLDNHVSLSMSLTIPFACSLIAYIPVSSGGVGTTEAAAVAAFTQLGGDAANILASYLYLRVLIYSVAGAVAVVVFTVHRIQPDSEGGEPSEATRVSHA